MSFDLPAEVLSLVEFQPVEDIAISILRGALGPSMPVYSLIPQGVPRDFVLVRQAGDIGQWNGEERFVDRVHCTITTFTSDPDGDSKGALLSEACRVAMRNAWLTNQYVPGFGWVRRVDMTQKPVRRTDWATSTGPVQYADLPTGVARFEGQYAITVRPPR